eukprot:329694-Amphidinium_carterae.1
MVACRLMYVDGTVQEDWICSFSCRNTKRCLMPHCPNSAARQILSAAYMGFGLAYFPTEAEQAQCEVKHNKCAAKFASKMGGMLACEPWLNTSSLSPSLLE